MANHFQFRYHYDYSVDFHF